MGYQPELVVLPGTCNVASARFKPKLGCNCLSCQFSPHPLPPEKEKKAKVRFELCNFCIILVRRHINHGNYQTMSVRGSLEERSSYKCSHKNMEYENSYICSLRQFHQKETYVVLWTTSCVTCHMPSGICILVFVVFQFSFVASLSLNIKVILMGVNITKQWVDGIN